MEFAPQYLCGAGDLRGLEHVAMIAFDLVHFQWAMHEPMPNWLRKTGIGTARRSRQQEHRPIVWLQLVFRRHPVLDRRHYSPADTVRKPPPVQAETEVKISVMQTLADPAQMPGRIVHNIGPSRLSSKSPKMIRERACDLPEFYQGRRDTGKAINIDFDTRIE